MKRLAKDFIGRDIIAVDGTVGTIDDLYFDDERWAIRYLICKTDNWASKERVLISPMAVMDVEDKNSAIHINLTQVAIAKSPDVSLKKPVSRRFELEYSKHFNIPAYWAGVGVWGNLMSPIALAKSYVPNDESMNNFEKELEKNKDESHLRSVKEVSGYHLQADDGPIGHIADFLVDAESWSIKHVVINTRNLLPGKIVLIEPTKIDEIKWAESNVFVHMTRNAIKESPNLK